MKKRILAMFLAAFMAITLLPTIATAGGIARVVEANGTEYSLRNGSYHGDGWDWDMETGTLTLNGFHGKKIDFGYYGTKIVLVEGSTNSLSEGLDISPSATLNRDGTHSVSIEGTGELIIDRITSGVTWGSALLFDEFHGPITIASPLQLTGGMNVGDNESLSLKYNVNPDLKPTYKGYKGGPGYAVAASGDSAQYVRIGPASDSSSKTPSGSTPNLTPIGFTDVPTWCAAAVDWAVDKKITNGTGNNKFSPDESCKNSEILTFLWRAAGEPYPGTEAPISLNGNEWYAEAVRWATRKGMIDEGFDPDALCTRSSALNFIFLGVSPNKVEITNPSNFADVSKGAYYAVAVDWAVKSGITNGTSPTTFGPDEVCSRGHIVTFLHRAYVPEARLQ